MKVLATWLTCASPGLRAKLPTPELARRIRRIDTSAEDVLAFSDNLLIGPSSDEAPSCAVGGGVAYDPVVPVAIMDDEIWRMVRL